MSTGIVEEIGTVDACEPAGNGRRFTIGCATVLDKLALGDSVSIDGACHTVTDLTPDSFSVQSVATTLERTILGHFEIGRRVNLERAAILGTRMGGHLVQGHVGGVGMIQSIASVNELVLIDFTLPEEVARVTVLHGSITMNGVSLTVNALPGTDVAQVSIIPFTWSHTALSDLTPGDGINLEGDLIGKYVHSLLSPPGSADLRARWGY